MRCNLTRLQLHAIMCPAAMLAEAGWLAQLSNLNTEPSLAAVLHAT